MHSNINISHTLPLLLVQIQGTIFTSSVHERDGGNRIQGKGSELVAGKGKCWMGDCKFIKRTFKSKMAMGAILSEEEVKEECFGK